MEHISERQVQSLLAKYSESHRNPTNEIVHFICVPAIVFSLLGMLWAAHPLLALAIVLASLVYYLMLSVPFAIGMLAMSGLMLWVLSLLPQAWMLQISIGIFVLAWIGQFIGHKIEGKKPSFLGISSIVTVSSSPSAMSTFSNGSIVPLVNLALIVFIIFTPLSL